MLRVTFFFLFFENIPVVVDIQRIINKLHTHVTDFRTNPAVFLGGGSLLLRKQIENSSEFKYVEFIDDVRANAIGYEKLTTARLRRG